MNGAELIPTKICRYLLDLPDQNGYVPVDDNNRPRVKLAKYLWYDEPNPLGKPLPTVEEKLSMLFDSNNPVLDTNELKALHPKLYRLYPIQYWGPSQLIAQTTLKVYVGRVIPSSGISAQIGINFEIMVNVNLENGLKTDAIAKSYAIETALISALNGVNIGGVGVMTFNRYEHIESGSTTIYDDEGVNVGRLLRMSMNWMESGEGI